MTDSVVPMYRRRFLTSFLFCLLVYGCNGSGHSPTEPSTPPAGGTKILGVRFEGQQTPVWCWAAVSQMVLEYYGHGVLQCQILSGLYQADCCTFASFCQTTASIEIIQQTLAFYGGIRSLHAFGAIPLQAVQAEINAGRPIIIAYRGSFSGHVVVVYGYDDRGRLYIHDPFYGEFVVPYGQTFTYNGQLVWADTIYGIG